MSMKGWGDPPLPKATRQVHPAPITDGFTRLEVMVLVPELALQGSDLVAVSVLEDPATGDWFGGGVPEGLNMTSTQKLVALKVLVGHVLALP